MTGRFDIVVIGGGVLGVSIAFWLSSIYSVSIAILDKEKSLALHNSSRNTGVVHRPFYIDPDKRGFMGKVANASYYMWKRVAKMYNLPWREIGLIEAASNSDEAKVLYRYLKWARINNMDDDEIEILDRREVRKLEPEVECEAAIYSKRDTVTHFGILSRVLFRLSRYGSDIRFIPSCHVVGIDIGSIYNRVICRDGRLFEGRVIVNAAGCGSLKLAHSIGVGLKYSELYFRGDYWIVSNLYGTRIKRNIYKVPQRREFPFLDPHLVVRYNGLREIGPSATPVIGGYTYKGLVRGLSDLTDFFRKPIKPKIKTILSPQFISLARDEWLSSVSKGYIVRRMRRILPNLRKYYLNGRGASGIRCQLISDQGLILNPLALFYENTIHIVNYNSPGATGAPAYSGMLIYNMASSGILDNLRSREKSKFIDLWSLDDLERLLKYSYLRFE